MSFFETPGESSPFGAAVRAGVGVLRSGGSRQGAVRAAATVGIAAVGTAVPAVGAALAIGEAFGFSVTDLLTTKSKANWRRTMGRIFRAALLGYVPEVTSGNAGAALRRIIAHFSARGDTTGAVLWDRLVQRAAIPTEKGGTKEGFGAGAPLGSKRAEAMPAFQGLVPWLVSLGL